MKPICRNCLHLSAVALAVGIAGCDRRPAESPAAVAVDTVGSTIIVTNPAVPPRSAALQAANSAGASVRRDTLYARQVASIGVDEGAAELMFGIISSVAVDAAGRIYVSDAMAEDVRVYTADGKFLERIGRGGDGPGEFRRPTGLAFGKSGNLFVRDETRVQRFGRASAASSFRYTGSHPGPAYGYSLAGSRIDEDGRLYYPRRAGRIPEQRHFYVVFDSAGRAIDTLTVPETVRLPAESAIFRTGRSGGRMVQGLSRAPFAPVPSWDVTSDGHLLIANGASYEIVEINSAGDTVRVIKRSGEPRPVPASELRDSTRAVDERAAAAPAPLEQLEGVAEEIRSGRLPKTLPEIRSVHVGTDGRIWVQRWPPAGRPSSIYDVFSRDGIYENTVVVPARLAELPAPVFSERRAYGIAVDPETEVQSVVVFEFDAP